MDKSKFTEELISLISQYQEDPGSKDISVDFEGTQEDIILDFIGKVIAAPGAPPASKAQWVDELIIDLNNAEDTDVYSYSGTPLKFTDKYTIIETGPGTKEYTSIENIEANYDSWRVMPDGALVYCINGAIMLLGKSEDGTQHSKILTSKEDSDCVYLDKGDSILAINLAENGAVSTMCITSETNLSQCGSVPLIKGELSSLLAKYIKDLDI